VDDYSLGTDFSAHGVVRSSGRGLYPIQKLSTDPSQFVVRGYLSDQAETNEHLITGETGYSYDAVPVDTMALVDTSASITAAPDAGPRRVPLPETCRSVVDPRPASNGRLTISSHPSFAKASFFTSSPLQPG